VGGDGPQKTVAVGHRGDHLVPEPAQQPDEPVAQQDTVLGEDYAESGSA
jgi:hypothetical protein